jgi:hypothetical protein
LRKLEHIKSIIKRSKAAGEIHVSPTLRTLLLNNKKKEQDNNKKKKNNKLHSQQKAEALFK